MNTFRRGERCWKVDREIIRQTHSTHTILGEKEGPFSLEGKPDKLPKRIPRCKIIHTRKIPILQVEICTKTPYTSRLFSSLFSVTY